MKWIKVSDGIPINNAPCLVKLKEIEDLEWATFDGDYWWEGGCCDSMTCGEVTDWIYVSSIPLPEPPFYTHEYIKKMIADKPDEEG